MAKSKSVGLRFYPNLSKKSKKTGKAPVYLKLTFNGKKLESRLPKQFDLGVDDLPLWDEGLMRLRGKNPPLNSYISNVETRFNAYLIQNDYTLKHDLSFLLQVVLNLIEVNKQVLVLDYFKKFMSEQIEPSNEIKIGTKKIYRNAISHFESFLKQNELTLLPLKEFKYQHAEKFKVFLGSGNLKLLQSTVSSNIRRIKRIFRAAFLSELIDREPFGQIKLVYQATKKTQCLSIELVKRIIECDEIRNRHELIFSRDLFLFGVFTGLSCVDYRLLKSDYLHPIDGRLKLDMARLKTNRPIVQILTKPAQVICEKYQGGYRNPDGYIFPSITGETINKHLKIIGALAGIPMNLSTKISRTTCNQLIINSGNWDPIYKRAFLGWSNGSDIQMVYTNFQDRVLLMNTVNLEKYLFENLGDDFLKIL